MPSLSCNAQNCVHNKNNCCCISNIKIGGKNAKIEENTFCENFVESIGGMNLNESTCNYLSIDCMAESCVYNSERICNAERVDIGGVNASNSKDTECATFKIQDGLSY